MPNPVAVNDLSPISGSLQTSRISYAVETAGKDYGQDYNGTTWYSDIPNNGQFYTIISDNYTANYYVSRSNAEGAYVEGGLPAVDEYSAPVFWVTPGTSSLDIITIVNGLPDRRGQIPFNSGSQALNWVASSSNYFAVGPDYYAQIDADNLQLYLNANQIISYPTTGSTWYDLSGYGNNGTLINGVSFNSNGWMSFDGTDDRVQLSSAFITGTGDFTVSAFVQKNTTGTNVDYICGNYGSGNNGLELYYYNDKVYFYAASALIISNATINNTRWHHIVGVRSGGDGYIYIDGVLDNSGGLNVNIPGNNPFTIGNGYDYNTEALNGSISEVLVYPTKAITATEVKQNYYGGPIVTSSLYSMLDASNLVSYPKTGTTTYTLTGSVNGTLTNGPTFTPAFGGGWVMDGVDDYLNTAVDSNTITPTNSWTVSIWCSLNSYPTITGTPKEGIIFGQAVYGGLGIYAISSTTGTVTVYGYFRSDSAVDLIGSYAWTLNTPTMFTLVHEAGVGCRFYVNGQLNYNYPGLTGGSWPSYMSLPFTLLSPQNGVYGGGSNTYIYYPITTYSTQVYNNKALTASEVLQNYNATK
jgi:hypothetical protein